MSWGENYDRKAQLAANLTEFANAHIRANPSQPHTSSGICTLPNGDSSQMSADECAKQKGHWSPSHTYVGWFGRGGGFAGDEPGETEEPGESQAEETGEEAGEAAGGGAAPSGGGGDAGGGGGV